MRVLVALARLEDDLGSAAFNGAVRQSLLAIARIRNDDAMNRFAGPFAHHDNVINLRTRHIRPVADPDNGPA